eukprot:TRINITY_DN14107_c0_g1_i1.p1 TRINITY_DN14107_c0_g1~~TRINITY_DN14107_c0_g1_i1.p1  ORF type:complete len:246 (-),score=24.63 TRINITY_DN14107_c0_g1_i1:11-748(-)
MSAPRRSKRGLLAEPVEITTKSRRKEVIVVTPPDPLAPSTVLKGPFYQREDTVQVAKELLGKYIFTRATDDDGREVLTGGMIVETEAYCGPGDGATQAHLAKKRERTSAMYKPGGISYVYPCYGVHFMLNLVTHTEGNPHCVLIRAIQPTHGIDHMLARRGKDRLDYSLTAGPGALTKALGIHDQHSHISLSEEVMWVEDKGVHIQDDDIICSARVGIGLSFPPEHALLPYRFRIRGNKYTSKAK